MTNEIVQRNRIAGEIVQLQKYENKSITPSKPTTHATKDFSEEEIGMVMGQTCVSRSLAVEALCSTGDVVDAILLLAFPERILQKVERQPLIIITPNCQR